MSWSRRSVLQGATAGVLSACLPARARRERLPSSIQLPYGVQSGDVFGDGAVIWARPDRPSRMYVRWSTTSAMGNERYVRGPAAFVEDGLTARLQLSGLPRGERIFYEVRFDDLGSPSLHSPPVRGSFWSAPADRRSVRLVWSGDTAGQGWGINEDDGGMRAYAAMADVEPHLFIHCGDIMYADGPIQEAVTLEDGRTWKNLVIPEVTHVAETLDDFRGRFAYNLLDANVRRFNAQVPIVPLWDDHEVVNNWYPGEVLDDRRYTERHVDRLHARATRAFFEYLPVRRFTGEPERLYRHLPYGPLLDIFRLDMRTYRGTNTANLEPEGTPFLGTVQLGWLKQKLLQSRATWKLIAADMPIGLIVRDGEHSENAAQGDGPPLGRERELAALLRFIKLNDIQNVVWITADVHYTAAHHYSPERAGFTEFLPFWEFVSGPLNAGTFGPNDLDNTFGPEVVFAKAPPAGQANLSPLDGYPFFGQIDIDGQSGEMTVTLKDLDGQALHTQTLPPQ